MRGWKKLHLGVDGSGAIVAHVPTDGNADDATTALRLIDAVGGDISGFTADGAYDTIAVYEAAGARGAKVVVPPPKTAAVSRCRPRANTRDRTITRIKKVGRRRWKKESGYLPAGPHGERLLTGTSRSSAPGFALATRRHRKLKP